MESIKLSNFRKIKNSWKLKLAPITFFTGTNNSGKSTIFKALLLLEDFVKSNNHFQLDFGDVNARKHKIDSYYNTINRSNRSDNRLDVKFEYTNMNHIVSLIFKPLGFDDDDNINKGKLRKLNIVRNEDGSSLTIENTGANDYSLILDATFLNELNTDSDEEKIELSRIKEQLAVERKSLQLSLDKVKNERNEIAHDLRVFKKAIRDSNDKNKNLKESFIIWLERNTKEKSGSISSYVKAIELLSETIGNDIFEIYDLKELSHLYQDLLKEQKLIGGKYFVKSAPSYGTHGFYSAAIKKYISYLDERHVSVLRLNKVLRELNISVDRAVEFLENNGIDIEKKPTSKISIDSYNLLVAEFGTDAQKNRALYGQISPPKQIGKIDIDLQRDSSSDFISLERKIIDLENKLEKNKKAFADIISKGKSFSTQSKDKIVFMPEFSLEDFDSRFLSIDTIIRKILPKYLLDNQKKLGKTDEGIELEKSYVFGEKILNILRFSVDHLSPQRNTQSRLYINADIRSDINELIKEHSNNPISKNKKAGKFLKKWMMEFDIGKDYKIKQIEGLASQIEVYSEGQKINIADKGFGAGQVFTILLKIALVIDLKEDQLKTAQKRLRRQGFEEFLYAILIEEPEANLHPALQSKLADLFYAVYKEYGIRFILETHSEYILRQSQVHIKDLYENLENPSNQLPFGVYYFDENKGPYTMRYDEEGKFIEDFGTGFFDVSRKLTRKLL